MNWHGLSNEHLLEQYQNGEFAAFDTFYKRNHRIVFCFLLKKTKNHELAEDLLQDTFCRIHKYILKYDPSRNAISWILTIAHNALITAYRKQRVTEELTDATDASVPPDAERIDLQKEIEAILGSLDEADRQLLTDRLVEEKSFDEISNDRGITPVNARQRVSRLLKRLRASKSSAE